MAAKWCVWWCLVLAWLCLEIWLCSRATGVEPTRASLDAAVLVFVNGIVGALALAVLGLILTTV